MTKPSVDELVAGVRAGDRAMLGRAITLIESRSLRHQDDAARLLTELMPATGRAWRVGITGVPGVGKSTFIDALGMWLVDRGHRVAVLAVDPSSTRSGGSILGDKTRMQRLSVHPAAFVRPSPTGGTLGGVTSHTREAMLVCESAGYDVVLVETVGVGQSELAVAGMTDFFLLLMLAGAGDELQGIKRGVMELADCVAVNKADGKNRRPAQRAAATCSGALRLLHGLNRTWTPAVLTVSGQEGEGVAAVWDLVAQHRTTLQAAGEWEARRSGQRVAWLWDRLDDGLRQALRADQSLSAQVARAEAAAAAGTQPPTVLARQLLTRFLDR
ncbi:MAG: methylmalonyl Co-A mutase-associated GTPase MeaB [Oligoflexia bacterium]|nr:methylmalonyl Co-A mutase-associated GTPase MeaB [Oligoflexia bacterium]